MIDLHLHTTASDGVLAPDALVARAAAAGITVLSVTDHDTVAGLPAARDAAGRLGLRLVPGIEITGVEHDRDVHILGYFFDPEHAGLAAFLREQRSDRVRRVRDMLARLAALGLPVDMHDTARPRRQRRRQHRPPGDRRCARRWRSRHRQERRLRAPARPRPAGVRAPPRCPRRRGRPCHSRRGRPRVARPPGAPRRRPADRRPGGARGSTRWRCGTAATCRRTRRIMPRSPTIGGWRRSGGSDFHGEGVHRACRLGEVRLPAEDFARLEWRVGAPR